MFLAFFLNQASFFYVPTKLLNEMCIKRIYLRLHCLKIEISHAKRRQLRHTHSTSHPNRNNDLRWGTLFFSTTHALRWEWIWVKYGVNKKNITERKSKLFFISWFYRSRLEYDFIFTMKIHGIFAMQSISLRICPIKYKWWREHEAY